MIAVDTKADCTRVQLCVQSTLDLRAFVGWRRELR